MIYLYAYTNHKKNLDNLRRIVALYKTLQEQNINSEILINDYRAQLLLKDWGLPLATTIETIKDIDAVASNEDIIIIDSPEEIEGKVINYPKKFKAVIYLNSSCKEVEFQGATIFNIFLDNNLIFTKEKEQKRDKEAIFIYGDSDYDKTILKNSEIFKNKNLDLYWGVYFFVKYEDKLAKIFNNIIESEEYYDILIKYQKIITSSMQIAIEARANGAFVEFLELKKIDNCYKEILNKYNIKITKIINNTDNLALDNIKINNTNNKIINIIKSYV